jgi:beta-galactosidase
VRVKNWFDFVNPKDLAAGTWTVTAGGKQVAAGELPALDIEARGEKEFTLPLPKVKSGEYFLNFSFKLKHDTTWAAAGHEIAWDQFALPFSYNGSSAQTTKDPFADTPLTVQDGPDEATFTGKHFSVRIDKKDGVLEHYVYRGVNLLERGPRPDFWRAPTNNDRGAWKVYLQRAKTDKSLDIQLWREAGPRWEVQTVAVEKQGDNAANISVTAALPIVGASYSMTYTIYGDGDIMVQSSYKPGNEKFSMMPRFGNELIVAPGLENISWYGRGPKETMIDRQFERIGIYNSTVDQEWVEYMRPQENGNKTDVRWVKLTNAAGYGIIATGEPALNVTARHFAKDDLEHAAYTFQMKRHPETFLNLDLKEMGAGGIDSWSANAYPMTPYRIPSDQPYTYSYRLSPVAPPAAPHAGGPAAK